MKKLVINGEQTLTGTVNISGAKNSAVALIPASIMSDGIVELENIPNISDIEALDEILEYLNVRVTRKDSYIKIDPTKLENKEIPELISKKLRASYYFMSALLANIKK